MSTVIANVGGAMRDYCSELVAAWNRFWFAAVDPLTLALIRVLAGAMLFYTHLVWTLDLPAFFGPQGWIPRDVVAQAERQTAAESYFATEFWSHWWWIESSTLMWTVHVLALVVFFCLMVGLFSRTMSVLAYLLAVSYVHRVAPAFFGLDKINCMLAMYLIVGPCGAYFSVDRWWRRRRAKQPDFPVVPSVSANVAIRLIQIHMCIIYLFSGMDKLQGMTWWDGTAIWQSVANYEYQSLDLTWLAGWPKLVALITHVTVFWEVFYGVLVWNRLARPIVLALAVAVHGGIALVMGMITFGLVMLIGNVAFLSPAFIRAACNLFARHGAGEESVEGKSRSQRRKAAASKS